MHYYLAMDITHPEELPADHFAIPQVWEAHDLAVSAGRYRTESSDEARAHAFVTSLELAYIREHSQGEG